MIPGCGGSLSVGTGARRAGPGAALRGDRAGRPGLHPGRRRHRQDPGDHPPDRPPGAVRRDRRPARARGHLHRPRRRRDAGPAHRARGAAVCRRGPSTPPRCARCGTSRPGCWPAGRCPSCWTARYGWSPSPPPGSACGPTGPPPGTWPARSSGPSRRWSSRRTTWWPRPRRCARRRTSRRRSPRCSPRTSSSSASNGVIDFEDLLRAAVWGIEEHPDVGEQVRAQYRHFVVDEYQDVNPLQQRLLDAWLGGRDDLTVVGDASQTIYSFTGATSAYLVDFPRRHRGRDRGPAGPRLPLHAAGGRAGQRGDRARPGAPRRGCGWSWSGSARPAPSRTCGSSPTSRPRRPRWPPAAGS